MKKTPLLLGGAIVLIGLAVGAGFLTRPKPESQKSSTPTNSTSGTNSEQTNNSTGFNKQQHSITDSSSLWVITNKKHPLSKGYTPIELTVPNILLRLAPNHEQMKISKVMQSDLEGMFEAAKKDGITLKLSSAYRSEALQTEFFNNYSARDGEAAAEKYSARPGTSEHQTGLAVDIIPANDKCHLEVCFADLPEGKWLAAHAHEHGFIIRYLKGKDAFTTYQYEPWHIRYVGKDLASELHKNGLTMEEFFNYN